MPDVILAPHTQAILFELLFWPRRLDRSSGHRAHLHEDNRAPTRIARPDTALCGCRRRTWRRPPVDD